MKIVITGASGFVGKMLVRGLLEAGCTLLLIGRDRLALTRVFPGMNVGDYDDLVTKGVGYDVLVHLAVANNDADLHEREFFAANVEFLLDVARTAKRVGIKRLINISSVHALDPTNSSDYARSKREGALALRALDGLATQTVYLPLVYGDRWSSSLAFLNRLPGAVARLVFIPFAALKPTVNIGQLTAHILSGACPTAQQEQTILSDDQDQNLVYVWTKRLIDLTFAIAVAVFLGWGLLLIWVAIRLDSPGPGIFGQARVGKNGRTFTCYKFRTMKQGTEQAGTHEVSEAAVTQIGAFLRRTKIDELPQIWNIIRNEISLVGPRPCLPVQDELVQARKARGVLSVKPGISGMAQVNGIDMSEPVTLARWDARYIALRSLLADLKVLIATATGRGQGDKTKRHN